MDKIFSSQKEGPWLAHCVGALGSVDTYTVLVENLGPGAD
jgi:hypothetical protein